MPSFNFGLYWRLLVIFRMFRFEYFDFWGNDNSAKKQACILFGSGTCVFVWIALNCNTSTLDVLHTLPFENMQCDDDDDNNDNDHDHDFVASDSECGELRIEYHQGFKNSLEMCIPQDKEMQ